MEGDPISADASAVDYSLVPHHLRLELLAALQRARAKIDAQEQVLLHALATDPPVGTGPEELDKQWVREEVACAMTLPPAVAQQRLDVAVDLVERLPATLSLLGRGEISLVHARRLTEAVRPLPDRAVVKVEKRVLERAPRQTVAQFAASVRRAVLAADPRDAEEQHQTAVADRRVVFTPLDHGVTELWALLPAQGAAALKARLDQLAAQGKGIDERNADQRRADALVDLALRSTLGTGATGTAAAGTGAAGTGAAGTGAAAGTRVGLRPSVHVTVALSTLLAVDEQPGELQGHGPIPASLARAIAHDPTGTWRRLVTDEHGQVIDAGHTTYRPPAGLTRFVQTRDQTCRFPGCQRAAERTEIDHIHAWTDGGATNADNLHLLCRRHHHLKHDAGWQVQRLPDGTTRWTTPTGHHHDRPPPQLPNDTTGEAA